MHRIGKKILHIGILIVALSVFLLYLIAKKYQILHATDVWAGLAVNNIIMPVGITFIFYSLIYHKSFFQSFLATKIMVKLGNATYSFYLLHTTFVLSYIFKFISTNVFIALITMIIVALFFFMLVEQPCANFLKRKFYRK
jgi:peptidoglycan/LPS O-acetylase OafA/YrhL